MVSKTLARLAIEIRPLERYLEALACDRQSTSGTWEWQESLTDEEVIEAANSCLETFSEGGHTNNDMLSGNLSKQEQKYAWDMVKKLKSLLKKFS
jgi:hypothetical protein